MSRGSYPLLSLFLALCLSPLTAMAGPAFASSFLSAGISEALSDLGYFLDAPTPAGWLSQGQNGLPWNTGNLCIDCLWSISLSSAADGAETGATVFWAQNGGLNLTSPTVNGASETHGPRSIKFEVTTPRFLAGHQYSSNVPVFSLELGATQPDTALEPGAYADASADPNAGAPLLDVFLGAGTCHSATRSFVVDELLYVGGELAKLTAHFRCGTRFAGVLRFDNPYWSGTPAVGIQGRVWEDENGDGVQAGDGVHRPDALKPDVWIDLFSAGLRVARTTSNDRGGFSFMVPVGSYQIGVETPRGMHVTLRDIGGDEARDSDIDPVSGRSDVFDTSADWPTDFTVGLSRVGGQAALPLSSTVVQPLLAGDRVSYHEERRTEQRLATDTVMPGVSVMNGSTARRVTDSTGNLQYLSNDARGLRLHRAVMLLPDSVNIPPQHKHAVIDFSPPLVLLSARVRVGAFASTGKATVRRLETSKVKSRNVTLNYAMSGAVTTSGGDSVAPGVLANSETAAGQLPVLSIARRLRFSGQVDTTPVSRLTVSDETYAMGVGLISSGVASAPRYAYFTAVRQGFGDDIDGDRRGDVMTVDGDSLNSPSLAAAAPTDTKTLQALHPRFGATTATDLGRVPAHTVLHGDFDADGTIDLLTYDHDSGLVALLHPNDNSEQAQPLAFAAAGLSLVASGDFHHDGHRTLLWRDANGALTQWRLDGTVLPEIFQLSDQAGPALSAPAAWTLTGVGDFNADGASDLLWRETGGQRSVLWLMDGAVRVAKIGLPRLDARCRVMAVNDFDGDGHSDLLWYDPVRHTMEVWLLNESGVAARKALGRPPAGAKVLASGDYDGNGNADVLWRSGARLSLWLLRNGALYKSGDAGSLTPNNTPLP